jgi:hypothetical protein
VQQFMKSVRTLFKL